MKTRLDIIDPCDLRSEIIRKRNEKYINQDALANRLNVPKTRIWKIENGKMNLSILEAEQIFRQMGYILQIALTEIK